MIEIAAFVRMQASSVLCFILHGLLRNQNQERLRHHLKETHDSPGGFGQLASVELRIPSALGDAPRTAVKLKGHVVTVMATFGNACHIY